MIFEILVFKTVRQIFLIFYRSRFIDNFSEKNNYCEEQITKVKISRDAFILK